METVNNMATAAAKAVWGDNQQTTQHGNEPVSGQSGDTSKGEPYDAGNIEDPKTGGSTNPATEAAGKDAEFARQSGTAPTSTTTTTSEEKTPAAAAAASATANHPSTELKTRDAAAPEAAAGGQADTRSPEDPKTHPAAAPTDVDDTSASQPGGVNEGQKLSAPGPKPLDEVARERGGDAGTTSAAPSAGAAAEEKKEEEGDGPNAKSTGEGTGEQYVKSTGLQADGGDFDVTKPGAGREADRLMEEKGMHPGAEAKDDTKAKIEGDDHSGSGSGSGEKKGLGQKIKEKLHRH
ncbi:hypothetical protein GGR56DRAFT_300275 [Xylariaceae sp. FL0804]|nr:hypothetical protein GGR56DRAFT_300275 [Xylariaceae sp. FL0804]